MDASGNPVTDGVYQITFRLYAQTSGGSQLWSASTTNGLPGGSPASVPVQVKSGLFSVLLGDASNGQVAFPDNLFNNDSLYLGVKVAADSEMTPRKRLSAVPYAYNSETLQGQYASHTVANTGGDLFGLRQASNDGANATRTALYVETKGTSDIYDFLLRMSDGSNDVFSVNRQGNVTVGGILDVNGQTTLANASATSLTLSNNLWVSGTASSSRLLYINATGTNLAVLGFVNSDLLPQLDNQYALGSATNRWKGVFAVSVTSTNISANYVNAVTVSTTNLMVNGAAVTTSVPTWQQVTNEGNVTNKDVQFAGGTSTSDFRIQGDLSVVQLADLNKALFINATGTNIAILGRVNSNLLPMQDATYVLGTQTYRWLRLNAANVSSTNADLTGYLKVNGKTTLTNVSSTNQDVSGYLKVVGKLGFGNASGTNLTLSNQLWSSTVSTTRALFINATGTNFALTGKVNSHLLPMHDNTYDLGSSDYQWRGLYVVNATATGIVTTDLVATGNVDLGIGGGEVNIISNLSMSSATSQPRVWWTNSNAPSTGVHSVRTMGVFNAYLYAGQGDTAGLGDLLMCDPTIAGNSSICDNAADWSKVIDNASASRINTMSSYYGRLYVGEGRGAGLGVIRYCRPELTGNSAKCEAADWGVATSTSFTQIRSMIEYNGYFYAAADSVNVAGKSAVLFCNPTKGGVNTDCDNTADWTSVPVPIGTYEEVPTITVFNGRLYAMTGNSSGDGDYMVCTPNVTGNSEGCDAAADWSRVLNNSGTESIESSAAYNGFMFNGTGNSAGKANVRICNPSIAGNRMLCDNANDFSTIYSSSPNQTRIPALVSYGAHLFFGAEGATGDGNIYDYNVSYVTTSHNTATFQATYSFAQYNGYLYAGRGNAAGNGQVWYYRREKSMSNALSMNAGRSLGSMWFDEDSLDSLGPGSSDSFAKAAFKFSHGIITDAGAYDLAETYPTNDSSLEPGEVVSIDENNQGYVHRSNASYEKGLMGVISGNPGFLLSGPQNGSSRAVALVGRVGVRISLENGDIKAGDPLTSAAKPGYAMKATRPGMIIGHALGNFTSSTAQTATTTNPTVLMVVQPGYFFGDDSTPVGQLAGFLGESTSTQVIQQAFQGDTYAISQVSGGMVNPQVADGSDVNGLLVANVGTLIVRTAALVAGDLTVGGTSRLMGHVVVSNDSAGVVDLPAGEQYVEIRFVKPYDSAPVVVVTPESDAQEYFQPWMGKFRVGNKTVNGFRIYVDDGACIDPNNCGRTMRFNWMAVGIQSQTSDESASSTSPTLDTDLTTQTTSTDATIGSDPAPENTYTNTDASSTLDGFSVTPTSTQETVLPDQTPALDTDAEAAVDTDQQTDPVEQTPTETVTTQPTEEPTVITPNTP